MSMFFGEGKMGAKRAFFDVNEHDYKFELDMGFGDWIDDEDATGTDGRAP